MSVLCNIEIPERVEFELEDRNASFVLLWSDIWVWTGHKWNVQKDEDCGVLDAE